jgi:hypothetical protein
MVPGKVTAKELMPEFPVATIVLFGDLVTAEVPTGFVVFQANVTWQLFRPAEMMQTGLLGEMVPVIVGRLPTDIVTESPACPPELLLQDKLKVVLDVSAPVKNEPERLFAPLQPFEPPEPLQEVALLELQRTVVKPLKGILVWSAERERVTGFMGWYLQGKGPPKLMALGSWQS